MDTDTFLLKAKILSAIRELDEASYNLGWYDNMDNIYSEQADLDEEHRALLTKRRDRAKDHLITLINEVTS